MGSRWLHLAGLLVWIGLGASLRFAELDAKPPWTDEFATLVFSLGHSFESVPLNQVISLDALLQPLQLQPQTTVSEVVQTLLTHDVHPPLYFVLAHQWMQWFSPPAGFASITLARSLPALLSVVSIPAMFGLGCLIGRFPQRNNSSASLTIAHAMAAFMAVSPYSIYLAQEARHYTLAIVWVIASLGCLVIGGRCIQRGVPLPIWLCGIWIGVNTLGVATHYFFGLTLAAIALALTRLAVQHYRKDPRSLGRSPWQRLYIVALGTAATASLWFPIWQTLRQQEITQWIQTGDRFSLLALIKPLAQSFGTWLTMFMLLPVEASWLPVVIVSGLLMLAFFWVAVPALWRGLEWQRSHLEIRPTIQLLSSFVVGAIALFFIIAYGGSDLTRGARYAFVYFPGVVALLGIGLAGLWQTPDQVSKTSRVGKRMAIAIGVMGLAGGLTVVSNLGYQKYYRPDQLVPFIYQQAQEPTVIATTQNTLVQIGETMGIGWEWQRRFGETSPVQPQFLLAHQTQTRCTANCSATQTLDRALSALPRPLKLWTVNFYAPLELEKQNCITDEIVPPYIDGYEARLYHCIAERLEGG